MSDKTNIEWADATWNPVRGCAMVSAGCTNCYAMGVANRFKSAGQPYEGLITSTSQGPKWSGNITLVHDALDQPLRWKKPRRIFVNSMSDLFHEGVHEGFINKVFAVMAMTPWHTYQILTKRPERMRAYLADKFRAEIVGHAETALCNSSNFAKRGAMYQGPVHRCLPLQNVWLGVSVENQEAADERIPLLLQTPAAIRFLSMEPLLAHVELDKNVLNASCGTCGATEDENSLRYSSQHGHYLCNGGCDCSVYPDSMIRPAIDWVIVGGESGPKARPMHPDLPRSLRDQCAATGTPYFHKQNGEFVLFNPDEHSDAPGSKLVWSDGAKYSPSDGQRGGADLMVRIGKARAGRLLDGREWNDFPEAGL